MRRTRRYRIASAGIPPNLKQALDRRAARMLERGPPGAAGRSSSSLLRILTFGLALCAAVAQCPAQCWQPNACLPPLCGTQCCERQRWRQRGAPQFGSDAPIGSVNGANLPSGRGERRRQRLVAQHLSMSTAGNEVADDPITASLHHAVLKDSFHAPLLVPSAESLDSNLAKCRGPGAFGSFDMVIVVFKASRRGRVERLLRHLCLNATLIEAPEDVPAPARKRRERVNSTFGFLTESELRVVASMRQAHQLFLASAARQLLIFEDTFVPSGPRLHARLEASLAALPSQWDLLFLGRCKDSCDGEHMGGDLYRTFRPRCLHAHAATREGSFAFLEALESCPMAPCLADLAATSVAYVRGATFAVSPSLFVQSPTARLSIGADRRSGFADRKGGRRRKAYYPECEDERAHAFHSEALGRSSVAPGWRRRSMQEVEVLNGVVQLVHGSTRALRKDATHCPSNADCSLSSCDRLAPQGRMLDGCDVHDNMLVPSLDMSACALQYVACVRRGDCSDARNPRAHNVLDALHWRQREMAALRVEWKPSDSLCPAALSQPRPNAAIQLQQTLAAALFSPAVLRERVSLREHVGPRFFEDASWPKAPSCISDPGAKQNDLSVRTIRVVRNSELNPNRTGWLYLRSRAVVFKPMIKVGSNFYRTYLRCLMPGEWEQIPESTKMLDARAVVIVRHPFSRFVSAIGEVLARVFNRRCPWGQCNAQTDYYLVNGPWASIRAASLGTRWYSRAALVLANHVKKYATLRNGSKAGRGFDETDLRRLVRSFVHDTVCNRHYYASEHFLTQTGIMSQPLAPKSGMPTVPISTTVHAEDVQRAGSVDIDRLLAAFGIEATSKHRDRAAQCYSQASADGNVASSKRGIRALPRAPALLRVINSDPSMQSLLCAVYYSDFVCLGYDLPAICKSIFPK